MRICNSGVHAQAARWRETVRRIPQQIYPAFCIFPNDLGGHAPWTDRFDLEVRQFHTQRALDALLEEFRCEGCQRLPFPIERHDVDPPLFDVVRYKGASVLRVGDPIQLSGGRDVFTQIVLEEGVHEAGQLRRAIQIDTQSLSDGATCTVTAEQIARFNLIRVSSGAVHNPAYRPVGGV